jgi:large subunit ribosomal protein L24
MANIKKGDLVQVIAGASKGKQGQVLAVLGADNKVIVQGINLKTRHTRVTQNDRGVKQGGIEQAEAPIHISNVQVVDPSTKKPTRIGAKVETVTKKTVRVRIAKKSGKEI